MSSTSDIFYVKRQTTFLEMKMCSLLYFFYIKNRENDMAGKFHIREIFVFPSSLLQTKTEVYWCVNSIKSKWDDQKKILSIIWLENIIEAIFTSDKSLFYLFWLNVNTVFICKQFLNKFSLNCFKFLLFYSGSNALLFSYYKKAFKAFFFKQKKIKWHHKSLKVHFTPYNRKWVINNFYSISNLHLSS